MVHIVTTTLDVWHTYKISGFRPNVVVFVLLGCYAEYVGDIQGIYSGVVHVVTTVLQSVQHNEACTTCSKADLVFVELS